MVNNGRRDSEPGQFRSLGPQNAARNLIVVKFTFGGGKDRAEIFRNPPSSGSLPARADAVLEGDLRFDRIAVARFAGKAPAHAVDEIRFGTQPADVWPVKVPEEPARRRDLDELRSRVDRLLLVKRHAFQPTHIYTECFDGPYRPGGGLYTLSPVAPDGQLTRIFDAQGGICRDPEVSFDGRRILFSYRSGEDGFYHVYEMNVDGSGLRQLTDGPFHDLDPFYLPDGRIGLTSSRCKAAHAVLLGPVADTVCDGRRRAEYPAADVTTTLASSRPTCCPTAGSCTRAGSTWTRVRSSSRACGRSCLTEPAHGRFTATT